MSEMLENSETKTLTVPHTGAEEENRRPEYQGTITIDPRTTASEALRSWGMPNGAIRSQKTGQFVGLADRIFDAHEPGSTLEIVLDISVTAAEGVGTLSFHSRDRATTRRVVVAQPQRSVIASSHSVIAQAALHAC